MALFLDLLKGKTNYKPLFFKQDVKKEVSRAAARVWYRTLAQTVKGTNIPNLIKSSPQNQVTSIEPGRMYLFNYDAKLKDVLPYWDRFPLIFPFSVESDHFLGINLHYLPLIYRAQLMDALYDITNNKKFDKSTKLKISYELLKNTAKFKNFKPCVKMYLNGHVKSNFLLVPSDEWDIALFLPLERFTKNKNVVYRDSTLAILK